MDFLIHCRGSELTLILKFRLNANRNAYILTAVYSELALILRTTAFIMIRRLRLGLQAHFIVPCSHPAHPRCDDDHLHGWAGSHVVHARLMKQALFEHLLIA